MKSRALCSLIHRAPGPELDEEALQSELNKRRADRGAGLFSIIVDVMDPLTVFWSGRKCLLQCGMYVCYYDDSGHVVLSLANEGSTF